MNIPILRDRATCFKQFRENVIHSILPKWNLIFENNTSLTLATNAIL